VDNLYRCFACCWKLLAWPWTLITGLPVNVLPREVISLLQRSVRFHYYHSHAKETEQAALDWCQVQISVGIQVVLTKDFCGFPHSLQAGVGIMSYVTTTCMQTFLNSISYPATRLYSYVVSIVEVQSRDESVHKV
jgi:hypothetical protein